MPETEQNQETGTDLQTRVEEVINESIRPFIQADGGDIELVGVHDGKVSVRLQGACAGCPGATYTLRLGVERTLQEKIPEVKEVIAVP